MWATGAIVVVVLALVACLAFCLYKKCFGGKKKTKKVRERKGVRRMMKKEKDGEAEKARIQTILFRTDFMCTFFQKSVYHSLVNGLKVILFDEGKLLTVNLLGRGQTGRGKRAGILWKTGILTGLQLH